MSKTKEELNELKNEYEALTTKLKELTEDELNMVTYSFFKVISVFNNNRYFIDIY